MKQLTKDNKNTENFFDFAQHDTVTTNHHTYPILSSFPTNTTNNSHVNVENNLQDGQVVDSLHSNIITTIKNSHNENSLNNNSHNANTHNNNSYNVISHNENSHIGISHIDKSHRETIHNENSHKNSNLSNKSDQNLHTQSNSHRSCIQVYAAGDLPALSA